MDLVHRPVLLRLGLLQHVVLLGVMGSLHGGLGGLHGGIGRLSGGIGRVGGGDGGTTGFGDSVTPAVLVGALSVDQTVGVGLKRLLVVVALGLRDVGTRGSELWGGGDTVVGRVLLHASRVIRDVTRSTSSIVCGHLGVVSGVLRLLRLTQQGCCRGLLLCVGGDPHVRRSLAGRCTGGVGSLVGDSVSDLASVEETINVGQL
mmetsp:Transcript_104084/g.155856  ORF Transcript_104084/g.155856 Transcript_104084/m.155856 type:complete len:203 (+) Transcript_104084:205-813(+)